ncbi:hypothetical protein CDA09_08730 [Azoarcus sp. DN11]|nr:hypothetical protein CDA09_08730 [Azoarcus sp. DN11]
MQDAPNLVTRAHGERCGCRLLAAAVGCPEHSVNYRYCALVLRRHWLVECDHQCLGAGIIGGVVPGAWHDLGPIDPVKLILFSNA